MNHSSRCILPRAQISPLTYQVCDAIPDKRWEERIKLAQLATGDWVQQVIPDDLQARCCSTFRRWQSDIRNLQRQR